MKNLIQRLKETPHLTLSLANLKLPYGAISLGNGFMVGLAQAGGVDLGAIEMSVSLGSTSVIAAARAGIGTTRGNSLATIINYVDAKQQIPKTEEEQREYNSLENIGKRCAKVGLRYQIETLVGYCAGYVYGKLHL